MVTDAHAATPRPLGLIAGSNLSEHEPFAGGDREAVETPWGAAAVYRGGGWALVLRHGESGSTAPHRINHRANVDALRRLGCRRVVSFCSVGALRTVHSPGMLLVPEDYINLAPVLSFHDEDPPYATPVLAGRLRSELAGALESLGERFAEGGVYYQTIGPRLETRAEVRMLGQFADVVGMTFGHEATLCAEAGLEVAALCSVDNYAHGVEAGATVRAEEILRAKAEQSGRVAAVARRLLERVHAR